MKRRRAQEWGAGLHRRTAPKAYTERRQRRIAPKDCSEGLQRRKICGGSSRGQMMLQEDVVINES